MAKTCIICSGPAGSGEHTFPAAFGGRRTNKGIYCNKHNNELGRHVAALLHSMDIINASLGVIPDRRDDVRLAPAVAHNGEQFLVSKGAINIASPSPLNDTPHLVGKKAELRFANMEKAREWTKQQERAGYKINWDKVDKVKTLFIARPLSASRTFGAEPFMRGVMYLAVTFLAHAFPDLSRSKSLAAVRDLIEKDGSVNERVWWEPPTVAEQLSRNPFNVGHTIAIAPDTEGRRIVALVSFYNALHMGVDLGEFVGSDSLDQRFTIHIDPMAYRPYDVVETFDEGNCLALSSPAAGKEYLRKMVSGQLPNPVEELFAVAEVAERKETAAMLLPELEAVANLTGFERDSRLDEILVAVQQRVFNLMLKCVSLMHQKKELLEPERAIYSIFVSIDENASRGISSSAELALMICTHAVRARIEERLAVKSLNVDSLADLLGGKEGFDLVDEALANLFSQLVPRRRPGTGW